MALLTLLSYAAAAICFVFVTLSLASGLLYLAEVIEEQSRAAKVFGTRAIYAIIALHVLLWAFDSLPLPLVGFSITCHVVYLQNLGPLWPFISLKSPSFIASCVLVVADHFLWFHHFAGAMQDARRRAAATYHRPHLPVARVTEGPSFMEVAAFFGVCVWLVPLFLFLSLSANDNALPTMSMGDGSRPGTPLPGQQHSVQKPSRSSLFKTIFDSALDLAPQRLRPRRNTDRDGLLGGASHYRDAPQPSPSGSWTFADGQTTPRMAASGFTLAPPPMGAGGTLRRKASESNASRRGSLDGAPPEVRVSPRIPAARLGLGLVDVDHLPRPGSPLKKTTM
ncbi:DUF396-domain-containing protein [Auricularia subglabra TFB-10046 SS5]|nr:DUF396-domain-containing protein [Auricularia subglabra TFB-10046 SS5]